MSNEKHEKRCVELRFLCVHYRYVAVYLPDYPEVLSHFLITFKHLVFLLTLTNTFLIKDEEYTLSCSTLYYAAAPVAGGAFLLFTIGLLIVCHMCRIQQKNRQEDHFKVKYSNRSFLLAVDESLATLNPRASIVRVQPFGPEQRQRTERKRTYGATSPT